MGGKINLKMSLIMALLLVGIQGTIAAGDVIYVDDDASLGGNGQNWTTPYRYLQDALKMQAHHTYSAKFY